jgi:flavin reductase (DIM6/NTAB) family NADH-FMN oxidoreductase RutF
MGADIVNNQTISIQEFSTKIHAIWNDGWFILTAGDFSEQKFNSMTISWGSMGTMWNKPFVQVVVRPTRFTLGFMDSSPDFTICAFPEKYRKALNLLGAKSGRDGDKVKESGLTPCKSSLVASPSYIDANLVIECRKIYTDIFKPQGFIDSTIEKHYHLGDYHRIFFGEVLTIRGDKTLYS